MRRTMRQPLEYRAEHHHQHPVRPELVEGPLFLPTSQQERCFGSPGSSPGTNGSFLKLALLSSAAPDALLAPAAALAAQAPPPPPTAADAATLNQRAADLPPLLTGCRHAPAAFTPECRATGNET